jgi:hypothetical protein
MAVHIPINKNEEKMITVMRNNTLCKIWHIQNQSDQDWPENVILRSFDNAIMVDPVVFEIRPKPGEVIDLKFPLTIGDKMPLGAYEGHFSFFDLDTQKFFGNKLRLVFKIILPEGAIPEGVDRETFLYTNAANLQ